MTLSEADRFLLDGIRRGDEEAWRRLVDRYRGRLLAFARGRLRNQQDAEDVLQETFMTFLRGLANYRAEAGLETYLFTILRRRLVDFYRGRRMHVCLLADLAAAQADPDAPAPDADIPAAEPTASVYARRDEHNRLRRDALAEAVRDLVNAYKKGLKFRELKIIEMLFYCQLPNKRVAELAGLDEKHVALIKHRCLKRIREKVAACLRPRGLGGLDEEDPLRTEALLTEVWESLRLSCPKRSTLGALHLGSLEGPWADYVDFHVNELGCRFCRANLDDLRCRDADASATLRERILQSTVGFLRQSYRNGAGR